MTTTFFKLNHGKSKRRLLRDAKEFRKKMEGEIESSKLIREDRNR